MTKRSVSGKRFSRGGANLRPIRLVLEPLETRRLLAGLDFSGGLGTAAFLSFDPGTGPTAAQQASCNSSLKAQAAAAWASQSDVPEFHAEGESGGNSFALPENASPGTLLGKIAFSDPLNGQQYTLHSADPRFSISGNELYFSSGELDFESEPMIGFEINAVGESSEILASAGVVVTISDVNEAPSAIELSGGKVYEHEAGAMIGTLAVIDADMGSQESYAFYLFDARFTMSGDQLRLADGVELDYATEPEVMLAVAATDGTHEIFASVRIEVLQRDQTPVALRSIALDPGQVVELTAGAGVGQASVVDPVDATYEFSVSDARFEFVGNKLKLRDDVQVDATLEPEIALAVTAVGNRGDEASGTFLITVTGARSPYHNYNLNEDVNGDGFVSPIDALLIINELNARGSGPITVVDSGSGEGPLPMLDVNGDGMITPIDVLIIINHLNRSRSLQNSPVQTGPTQTNPAQETPFSAPLLEEPATKFTADTFTADTFTADKLTADRAAADAPDSLVESSAGAGSDARNYHGQFSEQPADRRRRENESIDAELELLLEQLAASH